MDLFVDTLSRLFCSEEGLKIDTLENQTFFNNTFLASLVWFTLSLYIYIYMIFTTERRFFDFNEKVRPKCDSNPQPCNYAAMLLTTKLFGRMIACRHSIDCRDQIRIPLRWTLHYSFYFHLHSVSTFISTILLH